MRCSAIQIANTSNSKAEKMSRALDLIEQAPASDLYILPELWPSGAFDYERFADDAESIDGPLVERFREEATSRKAWIHMGSFIERDADGLYNTSILINSDGEIAAAYRKIHLFGFESKERELLRAGNRPVCVDAPWGRVGLATCYDLRFPELFRRLLDDGAECFLVASAWPLVRLDAWRLFNQARAHENLAFLLSANSAGNSGALQMGGHSMAVDPTGLVLAEAGEDEQVLTVEIDLEKVSQVRREFPAVEDRVL